MRARCVGLCLLCAGMVLEPGVASAQDPCLKLPNQSRWAADSAGVVTLTRVGKDAVGADGVPVLVVTPAPGQLGSATRVMVRPFPPSGDLRLRLDAGSYHAQLARLPASHGRTIPPPTRICTVNPLTVDPPKGPWTPTPQVWLSGGYAFADVGIEALELLGKWGLAAGATVRRHDGDAVWDTSVLARRSATRGYFDLGVRRVAAGALDRAQFGVGLEMPPYRGHPFWITVTVVPTAWPLSSPSEWTTRADWDLFFGVRLDLRRVTR